MQPLTVQSPSDVLNDGFAWARALALSYVQTGRPGYLPCYWAGLLDRRSFYIRDYVHQAAGAHLLGMRAENLAMLRAFAASATAARQWYPVWNIGFGGEVFHMDYHHDGNFVREIPMTFELVETGYQLYRWTGDERYVRDGSLWDYYTHAVTDFIALHNRRGDGVATEGGAPGRSKASARTTRATTADQAADGIGCQYQALLAYAAMQRARGETAAGEKTTRRARELWQHFQTKWWLGKEQTYARGMIPSGRLVTGFLDMTNIYLVAKELAEPGPRCEAQLNLIERKMPYVPGGAAPCSSTDHLESRSYLPQLFFACGRDETGWKRLVDIMATRSDYPEIPFTVIGHVVEGLMGCSAGAPQHALSTLSHLPAALGWCEAAHIPVGEHMVSLRHDGSGSSVLTHEAGPGPLAWEAQFAGTLATIKVNGVAVPATQKLIHGRTVSSVTTPVEVGQRATASRA